MRLRIEIETRRGRGTSFSASSCALLASCSSLVLLSRSICSDVCVARFSCADACAFSIWRWTASLCCCALFFHSSLCVDGV